MLSIALALLAYAEKWVVSLDLATLVVEDDTEVKTDRAVAVAVNREVAEQVD